MRHGHECSCERVVYVTRRGKLFPPADHEIKIVKCRCGAVWAQYPKDNWQRLKHLEQR